MDGPADRTDNAQATAEALVRINQQPHTRIVHQRHPEQIQDHGSPSRNRPLEAILHLRKRAQDQLAASDHDQHARDRVDL
jgi:hypothetical protein